MNKLQLYITMSNDGFKSLVDINNDDDYTKSWVCDLRQAVSQVAYDKNEMNIFYMLKHIDSGCFIVVLRTIPSRVGDHLASWIFVPYDVVISDSQLYDVVKFIQKKVSQDSVSKSDIAEMRQLFSRTYEDNILAPSFPADAGLEYAYRFYGAGYPSLEELIGKYRCQPCYLPYAGILLVDKEVSTDVAGDNLTDCPLDVMSTLLPPAIASVDGYHPTIYGEEFDVPYLAPMSRKIEIVWRKPGSPDKQVSITISKPEMRAPSLPRGEVSPQPAAWGDDDNKLDPWHPSTWEGRPSDTPHQNPSEPKQKGAPDVPTRRNVYNFEIPTRSAKYGTVIDFTVVTSTPIDQSPIEGYEAEDISEGSAKVNRLFYAGARKNTLINKIIFAACGLLVGLILGYLLGMGGGGKSEKKSQNDTIQHVEAAPAQESQPSQPAAQSAQPAAGSQATAGDAQAAYDLAAAIKYLDTQKKWEKGEMEKYPDLAGLFDDLNSINRTKIIDVWGPKLSESRVFTNNIVKHVTQGKKKTPKNQPFTQGNTISVQAYLNNVDP